MKNTAKLLAFLVVFGGKAIAADNPDLPDYTQSNFKQNGGSYRETFAEYPELGTLVCTMLTTGDAAEGEHAVFVCTDADKVLKYASWHTIEKGDYKVRVYLRKDNKWVFQKEM